MFQAISKIFSLMPVSAVTAFAESENGGEVTTVDSGYCGADNGGENLKWTLDNNGVLTISGSGAMKDYTWDENVRLDWYVRKKDIRSVVLDNRITHIGNYAFDKCTNIESVRYTDYTGNAGVALPKSVTTIGVHAYSDTGVTGTLKLPDDLIAIGSHAFYHCGKLTGELKLPDTVKEIGGFAFNSCGFTGKLELPASLENIGNDAFESCSGLTGKLTFPSKMNEIRYCIFHETGISEVVIPSSIKTVRDFAFNSCMNLKKVYLPTESVYKTLYQQQGLRFEQGADRLTVEGALTPGEYELAGNVSSQFISGLLFALPLLGGTSTLHLIPPVESRSYIDMTRAVQHAFGVESRWLDENTLEIPGRQHYLPCDYTVEGDYSQAAFPAVLGAVTGGVAITGLSEETLQGDAAILEFLRRCGA